jgi:putative ABC transport system permease protein
MFQNYFKIAWRNLVRDRQFSFLNLMGLSTGLACVLLIYLWVSDERSMDKFHEKDSRLFQVMERQPLNDGLSVSHRTSGLTAEELKDKMPEVEYAAAVLHYSWFPKFLISAAADHKIKAVGQFADKDFFHIFSYELIHGNKNQVLADKQSIVLSEALALKLFNTTRNVMGKVLEWELGGFRKQVMVSGIFKNIPANSSEQFDFLLSFAAFKEISPPVLEWGNNGTNAYVVLKKGTDIQQFNKKIAGFIKTKLAGSDRSLFLSRYSDNYLYSKYENGVQSGGRIEYVRLFSVVALFILLIACINFMNLSTAKASRRLKEVGVKKVMGASRGTLILQYMGESVLMAFLSVIISILLVWLLLPQFNAITGKQISLEWNASLILSAFGICLLTGLLSGSYPALYLSGFNPVAVLKGKLKASAGELWIRKGLVVFQFTLSVIFIISVLVVYQQIQLIQTKNLGYNKENIIYFTREGGIQENPDAFLSELKAIRGVVQVSATDHRFAGGFNTTGGLGWPGKHPSQDNISFEIVHADYDLIELLGIEMKEGRSFSRSFGADSTKIIFNEAAISKMGLKDPVGKIINLWGKDREILGVTKDFHFESLHQNVKPLFILLEPKNTHYVLAKIRAGMEKEVLNKVMKLYGTYNRGSAFDYQFLDDEYRALYASEQRVAVLSRYFAGLAIIISCLGLFGLAAFTAQRRQKEIGIRKVVGASVSNVVIMLSKDFLKLVLMAVLVAFPLAWWATSKWLEGFAYRVDIGISVFLIAGASIILITLLTISFQSIKAAVANPVKSLRTE